MADPSTNINRSSLTVFGFAGALGGCMLHQPLRESFGRNWELLFPGCDLGFMIAFNICMFSAYFWCQVWFGRKSMPRWLSDDPIIMSYTIVASLPVLICTYLGFRCMNKYWMDPSQGLTLVSRLTSSDPDILAIAHIHAAYQFWNLMISIMRQEDAVSVVHHVSACLLGLVLCNQGFGWYWCLYLGGVSETSTAILSVMDIFKLNPYLQKDYPTLNVAVRATFCIAFLIARVFIWWYVMFWFYLDLYYFWSDYGNFQRPHFTVVVNVISWTALTVRYFNLFYTSFEILSI